MDTPHTLSIQVKMWIYNERSDYVRTHQIATFTDVHPNTVRLYEDWHYISPVPRAANGYRMYSELHLKQMQIARLVFRQEFIQNNLRKKATQIVKLSGREQFKEALIAAENYYAFLQQEYAHTISTVETIEKLQRNNILSETTYTHKQVAERLNLTEETVRNWERNGLLEIPRNSQNRRVYSESDMQKCMVIRTLRSAHFSITSIAHLLQAISTKKDASIVDIVKSPKFVPEFTHVTDDLVMNLKKAMTDVEQVIALLKELQ